jgi:hypothetical protein
MMISETTARALKDSCTRFQAADAGLRSASVSDGLIEAASEYINAHEHHSEMIDKAEKEMEE